MSCCDMWSSSKRSGGSGGSVRAAPELTSVPRLGSKIGGDATVVGRHPANRGDKPGFRRDQVGEQIAHRLALVGTDARPVVRTDALEHLRQLLLGGDQALADGLFSVVAPRQARSPGAADSSRSPREEILRVPYGNLRDLVRCSFAWAGVLARHMPGVAMWGSGT